MWEGFGDGPVGEISAFPEFGNLSCPRQKNFGESRTGRLWVKTNRWTRCVPWLLHLLQTALLDTQHEWRHKKPCLQGLELEMAVQEDESFVWYGGDFVLRLVLNPSNFILTITISGAVVYKLYIVLVYTIMAFSVIVLYTYTIIICC